MLKKIAVLTSGGDSPGMNAAIRSVTRTILYHNMEAVGIKRGFEGLIEGDLIPLTRSSVGGILLRGGTMLRTARSLEFKQPEGIRLGITTLKDNNIDALVVIGGDGSFHGAKQLHTEGVTVVGIPGTIDNDMGGTDVTIGFDTSCNTVLENIAKLRDTASSHDRMFIVEVMGRHAGFLALETGVACGAEYVLVPEINVDIEALCKKIHYAKKRCKTHSLVVLAEGVMPASELVLRLKGKCDYDPKIVVLGHLQRGGAPSCADAVLASKLGLFAIETLMKGKNGFMVGSLNGDIVASPLEQAWEQRKPLNPEMLRLLDILSI